MNSNQSSIPSLPLGRALRVLNFFVPEGLRQSPESARRGRLIVGMSLICALATAVGLPFRVSVAAAPDWMGLQIVNLVVLCAAPFILRYTGRLALAGGLTLASALFSLILVSYFEGALRSPMVILGPFLPFMATMMLGRRAGLWTAAVISALTVTAMWMHHKGLIEPTTLFSAEQEITLRGLAIVITTMMVVYVVWLWESERRRSERELNAARRKAIRAAKAKGQFLANMSQEIQAPMAGIVGLSDLLLELDLPPQAWAHVRTISASTEKLRLILDDIGRVETGEAMIDVSEFSLRGTVDEVIDLLRPAATAKGVELVGEVHAAVDDLRRGDLGRLRQVLLNLAGNAIKFTDEGRVDLRVEPGEDETGVRFTIHDTGIGITAEDREELFELGEPPEDSGSHVFTGTGLGLAVSRQLAELMGGSIAVESTPRRGSTFTFTARLDGAEE